MSKIILIYRRFSRATLCAYTVQMDREKKRYTLYIALLVAVGIFFLTLFLFLADARKLHSEGSLRRPPKHIRSGTDRSSPPPAPVVSESPPPSAP